MVILKLYFYVLQTEIGYLNYGEERCNEEIN